MTRRVNIRIFPDGHIQAEIHGIKGKKCVEYIRILEEILEAETVDSAYTAEFYENESIYVEDMQHIRQSGDC
ncbi:MAG: hypothetical protein C4291_14350 [Candidatus Dadabacteria bacterium]